MQSQDALMCPACGAENTQAHQFCGKCGSKLTTTCMNCWKENQLCTEYCVYCGDELASSTFGLSPQTAQKWIDGFANQGWTSNVPTEISSALESIGHPLGTGSESIILCTGISEKRPFRKIVASGREIDGISDKVIGGFVITSKRLVVYSYKDGWIALYPFAFLMSVSQSEGGRSDRERCVFALDFGHAGTVKLCRFMPKMPKSRGMISRIATNPMTSMSLDMTTVLLVQALAKISKENTYFVNFFSSVTEARQKLLEANLAPSSSQQERNVFEVEAIKKEEKRRLRFWRR